MITYFISVEKRKLNIKQPWKVRIVPNCKGKNHMLYVKCCGHALNLTYQAMIKYPQVTYKTLKTALKISDSHEMMAEAFK